MTRTFLALLLALAAPAALSQAARAQSGPGGAPAPAEGGAAPGVAGDTPKDAPKNVSPSAKPRPKPDQKPEGASKALPTGLQVMTNRQQLTLGKTEVAELDIRIEAKRQFDHRRRLMRYVKREGGIERTLVRFEEPPGFRWLSALTVENKGGNDDQWLYLPSERKVRRVSRSETTESFAGTGFAFEDLRSEDLAAHTYETLAQVDVQGRPAFQIEAKPVPGHARALAGYSKRLIYVDSARWVEVRIEFFDEDGKLLKTQENADWRPVKDIVRPYRVFMREHKLERTTWILFRSWTANEPLDDALFTTREMAREDR